MQTKHKIFDDMAKVASGAMETMGSLRQEIEALVRHQVERILKPLNMVPREDFEVVKAMAAKARDEQETLLVRVSHLEKQVLDLLHDRAVQLEKETQLGPELPLSDLS